MSDIENFKNERKESIEALSRDNDLRGRGIELMRALDRARYEYMFDWLGLPIIRVPQDNQAVQELIWRVKPEAIVETGVARGGSLMLSASMLQLLGGSGLVVGVDIDIRPHNREAIERHPLANRITLVQGSSVERATFEKVITALGTRQRVMVFLDSNHTHEHVLAELRLYAPLVRAGSYLVVFDTAVDDMPAGYYGDRPWGPGNNPRTAVRAFLSENDRFEIDQTMNAKLILSCNPDGYLKCIRNP